MSVRFWMEGMFAQKSKQGKMLVLACSLLALGVVGAVVVPSLHSLPIGQITQPCPTPTPSTDASPLVIGPTTGWKITAPVDVTISQSFSLRNTSGQTVSFSMTTQTENGSSWFSVTPTSGTLSPDETASVTMQIDTHGMASGETAGVVSVTTPTSSQAIFVQLAVVAASGSTPTPVPTIVATPTSPISANSTSLTPVPTETPTAAPCPSPTTTPPSGAAYEHIVVMLLENHGMQALKLPGLAKLAGQGISAQQYYAITHNSQPNYLAILSGSTQGIHDNNPHTFNAQTLVDQLEGKGLTWKAYMEDLPSAGFLGETSGLYARKHNPFVSFSSITGDPSRLSKVVPFSQFSADLAGGLPNFVWITPNLCHDMHGGAGCTNPGAQGDQFVQQVVTELTTSPAWKNTLLLLTFDEATDNAGCCGATPGGGQVPLIALDGRATLHGTLSTPANHYSMLKTIEDVWGLSCLANACQANALFPGGGSPAPTPTPCGGTALCPTPIAGSSCQAQSPYGFTTIHADAQLVSQYQQLNVCWVRFQIHEDQLETAPGQYNWTPLDTAVLAMNAAGIHLDVPLQCFKGPGTGCFAQPYIATASQMASFATAVATRYNGKNGHGFIDAYEMFNEEPDQKNGFDLTTYGPILQAGYQAIKAASPDALVGMYGTFTPSLAHANAVLTALKPYNAYLDFTNFHYYAHGGDPNQDTNDHPSLLSEITLFSQTFPDKPIWITEIGWPVGPTPAGYCCQSVSAATQAQYLQDVMTTAAQSHAVSRVFWFTINYGSQPDTIYPPGGPLLAFATYQEIVHQQPLW